MATKIILTITLPDDDDLVEQAIMDPDGLRNGFADVYDLPPEFVELKVEVVS